MNAEARASAARNSALGLPLVVNAEGRASAARRSAVGLYLVVDTEGRASTARLLAKGFSLSMRTHLPLPDARNGQRWRRHLHGSQNDGLSFTHVFFDNTGDWLLLQEIDCHNAV